MEEKTARLELVKSKESEQVYWNIKGKDCDITIEQRPSYCDRGRYLAKVFPKGENLYIDDQDGWPRYYFNWDAMIKEINSWMRKKNQL